MKNPRVINSVQLTGNAIPSHTDIWKNHNFESIWNLWDHDRVNDYTQAVYAMLRISLFFRLNYFYITVELRPMVMMIEETSS
jgi:hypothetical protein